MAEAPKTAEKNNAATDPGDPTLIDTNQALKYLENDINNFNKRDQSSEAGMENRAYTFQIRYGIGDFSVQVPLDKDGKVDAQHKAFALDKFKGFFANVDFNDDKQISLQEMQRVKRFGGEDAKKMIETVANTFAKRGVSADETKKFSELANKVSRDGFESVAESKALNAFFKEHHIEDVPGLMQLTEPQPIKPLPPVPEATPAPKPLIRA